MANPDWTDPGDWEDPALLDHPFAPDPPPAPSSPREIAVQVLCGVVTALFLFGVCFVVPAIFGGA